MNLFLEVFLAIGVTLVFCGMLMLLLSKRDNSPQDYDEDNVSEDDDVD